MQLFCYYHIANKQPLILRTCQSKFRKLQIYAWWSISCCLMINYSYFKWYSFWLFNPITLENETNFPTTYMLNFWNLKKFISSAWNLTEKKRKKKKKMWCHPEILYWRLSWPSLGKKRFIISVKDVWKLFFSFRPSFVVVTADYYHKATFFY